MHKKRYRRFIGRPVRKFRRFVKRFQRKTNYGGKRFAGVRRHRFQKRHYACDMTIPSDEIQTYLANKGKGNARVRAKDLAVRETPSARTANHSRVDNVVRLTISNEIAQTYQAEEAQAASHLSLPIMFNRLDLSRHLYHHGRMQTKHPIEPALLIFHVIIRMTIMDQVNITWRDHPLALALVSTHRKRIERDPYTYSSFPLEKEE